ncbi:MAG TPA: NADP-dependent oxidoreductase [Bryobacteraceae bacterium]|jgi:NADPH:quinone reductase-like Zn-dependent oxidoreductase|nr:NADP-dependent oxidoreductase [Bryobacteraceae bacterium]
MHAILLHGYGGVDQLVYEDAPKPQIKPNEVLVRVLATSVNPIDWKIREGALKERMHLNFPVILGRDVAGEVVEVGSQVKDFKPGDRVMGLVNESYAEFLAAKANDLTRIPDGLTVEQAGALPLVTTTGAQLIEEGVAPKNGQTILVTGAAGSVGRTAVHVAKEHGATVIAGVRKRQKSAAATLGADKVVALDDDGEIAALEAVDAIADTVNGELIRKLLPKLKKSGVLASVLGKPAAAEKSGVRVVPVSSHPDAARLHQLAEEVASGAFTMPVTKVLPLRDARQAQELAENGVAGKIVLTP